MIENRIKVNDFTNQDLDDFQTNLNEKDVSLDIVIKEIEKNAKFAQNALNAIGEAPSEGEIEEETITLMRDKYSASVNAYKSRLIEANLLKTDIKVHANAAFVPTFIGDGCFVNVEFDEEVDASDIREIMKTTKNVVVFDKNVDAGYVSVDDVQGEDKIYVSRIRQDVSVENGISFWSVADNLRAGSAKLAFDVMIKMAGLMN